MARVEIAINGRTYTVACDEGQEDRVRELGAFVDEKLKSLGGGGASEAQLLVLTSLVLADELIEQRQGNGAIDSDEERVLLGAVEHLTRRVEAIAARLDQG
ncbi:cell division protein ZapA [Roseiterribacter gracilis]|uniref:Cell division protein ZapA n=1 Tax=Roseiterribacter gracilis TaxID=2812848 RepID=A0A8S8X9N5_9PROT|nr:cell division protein ZapA [Rhodospirillales bacterium TMPK1]